VVSDLSFSSSGSTLFASYEEDPYCVAWNSLSAERLFYVPHPMRVPCVRVNPAGFALATGCWDYHVRIFA